MEYTKPNSITHIVQVPVSDLKIILNDAPLKCLFLKRKNRADNRLNKKLNLQYKDLSK